MDKSDIVIIEKSFAYVVLCSRYFIFTYSIVFIIFIYFTINPIEYFKEAILMILSFVISIYILLVINYYRYSNGFYKIDKTNNTILIDDEFVPLKDLEEVNKIQTVGYLGDMDTFLIWTLRLFYGYVFKFNEKKHFITCFMMTNSDSEYLDRIFMGNFRIRRRLIPFMNKNIEKKKH